MQIVALVVGIVVGIVLLVVLFKPFFGGREEFLRCLGYLFKPDFYSWIQGDWGEDFVCTLKFQFWLFLGFGGGAAVYIGISALFGTGAS